MDNSGKVQVAALVRGAYNAAGTFAATFLITLATLDVSTKEAAISGGIAALAVLGFRAGGEGFVDSNRAKSGNVNASDVGAFEAPISVNK